MVVLLESGEIGRHREIVDGPRPLTRLQDRLISSGEFIRQAPPDRAEFLHSVLCHVGLPRRRTDARTFERSSGHVSVLVEAGSLYDGRPCRHGGR